MTPLAFLNGRFVRPAELTLSFADAGFVLGATVTDFCRTYRRTLFRWPDHLARFRRDCAACHVPLPYPDAELTAAAERLVQVNGAGLLPDAELAVVAFATPGPLGYLAGLPDNGPPTVGMHAVRLPVERYRRFFAEGVTLAMAGTYPTGGLPPAVKHRSRLHWWLADRAVSDPTSPAYCPGAVPVLLGADGTADTAIGSVLTVAGGTVVRPVPGTVLEGISLKVAEELCGRIGLRVTEGPLDFRSLCRPDGPATEVLLTGSGFGIAGVRRCVAGKADRTYDWPGPVYRALADAWSATVGVDMERQVLGEPGPATG